MKGKCLLLALFLATSYDSVMAQTETSCISSSNTALVQHTFTINSPNDDVTLHNVQSERFDIHSRYQNDDHTQFILFPGSNFSCQATGIQLTFVKAGKGKDSCIVTLNENFLGKKAGPAPRFPITRCTPDFGYHKSQITGGNGNYVIHFSK